MRRLGLKARMHQSPATQLACALTCAAFRFTQAHVRITSGPLLSKRPVLGWYNSQQNVVAHTWRAQKQAMVWRLATTRSCSHNSLRIRLQMPYVQHALSSASALVLLVHHCGHRACSTPAAHACTGVPVSGAIHGTSLTATPLLSAARVRHRTLAHTRSRLRVCCSRRRRCRLLHAAGGGGTRHTRR